MQNTRRGQSYEIEMFNDDKVISDDQMKSMFIKFIDTFRIGVEYIYRVQQAKENQALQIIIEHIAIYDKKMFCAVIDRPTHYIDLFREALRESPHGGTERYIEIVSQAVPISVRKLDANHLNRISNVKGIVLSVSSVSSRSVLLYIFCKTCLNSKMIKDSIPKKCDSCNGMDTFVSVPEKSILQDSQLLKIQEVFEDLPTGDIPRHLMALATGNLVDKVVPGATVTLTGIYSVGFAKQNVPFLRILGMEISGSPLGIFPLHKSTAKKAKVLKSVSRSVIVGSIAPEVFGHTDIKLALACALFGGVRRSFSDGITIRGDINVLLLGDPGIAKSQMLKFVSEVSPRGVYTSGKGASAAGLTASVCKDKRGNFYLEGGALVLADGGLCCIDEFDKMQEKDRVAIHEAMEQQTVSISKAGIVTSLNTRCAVVAAANPIFGRYDENRAPGENIDFGITILSRFDLVFVIRDNLLSDKQIAWHVLTRSSRQQAAESTTQSEAEEKEHLSVEALKEYVEYARNINPVLEEESAQQLQAFYIKTRKTVRECRDTEKTSVPITVRQLEAIARISEALARMELELSVTPEHVEEAIRLFSESTIKAVMMGHYVEGMPRHEWIKEFSAVEAEIKKTLPIGTSRPYNLVVNELCKQYSEGIVMRCLDGMIRRERISLINGGKTVIRLP